MSNTYELLCTDCRVSLWIAQGWVYPGDSLEKIRKSGRLYSMPEHLVALRDFLFSHMGHALQFVESQKVPYNILDKEPDDEEDDDDRGSSASEQQLLPTLNLSAAISTERSRCLTLAEAKKKEASQRGSFG